MFLRFFGPGVEAAGCFLFMKQRRQVYLNSMIQEWKTYGCSPSTPEPGFRGFGFFTQSFAGNPQKVYDFSVVSMVLLVRKPYTFAS